MILTSPDLQRKFTEYIRAHQLFHAKDRLLIAVSGGLDSAVLCALCYRSGFSFSIAHCNFGLRGEETMRDESYVRQLAKQYAVPIMVKSFQTEAYAAEQKLSIQEAARKLRYAWFDELLQAEWEEVNGQWQLISNQETSHPSATQVAGSGTILKHQYLLTAHHLDDNIETVAMHFFKGTGISGLRGILPKKNKVVRPLLFAKRSELETFAQANKLQWVEDSSNASTKYTRNFFRKELLPIVAQKMPQALDNIGDSIPKFYEAELLYQQAVDSHRKALLEYKGAEVHIPVLKLARVQPLNTIVYEILKEYGFRPAQTGDVVHLLASETGKYVRSATHQVLRHRAWIIIAPLQAAAQSIVLLEGEKGTIHFEGGSIFWQHCAVPKILEAPAHIAFLDAAKIDASLMLRRLKQGDYFYPLGLGKKKKVARFLSSQKLSKQVKDAVWVLQSGSRVAWVAGHRIDDRFKITAQTKQVLKVSIDQDFANKPARPK